MDKSNDAEMFQNADEINLRQKKIRNDKISPMKGALVMTFSKELVSQVYRETRSLDFTSKIRVNRLTSSLQMKSAIVEYLTPNKSEDSARELSPEEIFDMSMANVINNASWRLSDVIVANPITLGHILKSRQSSAPFEINPSVVVIDECDQLFEGDLEKKTFEVI